MLRRELGNLKSPLREAESVILAAVCAQQAISYCEFALHSNTSLTVGQFCIFLCRVYSMLPFFKHLLAVCCAA